MAKHPLENLSTPFPLSKREGGTPKVQLIVPVFNEEGGLEQLIEELAKTFEGLDVSWKVMLINDGSQDGSFSKMESLYESNSHVSYLALARNFGHQAALLAGFEQVSKDADVFICMDADLQHPPEMIPQLIDAWKNGYDVVHTKKITTEDLGTLRTTVTKLAYSMIQYVSSTPIIPHSSDFRLMSKDAFMAMLEFRESHRLHRGVASWVGFSQAVLPFIAVKRFAGHSNYGFKQLFSLFTRAFFDYSNLPLMLSLIIGSAGMLFSLCYASYIFINLLLVKKIPTGWTSLVLTSITLHSIQFILMGIMGIYIAKIFRESLSRPEYIIARKKER